MFDPLNLSELELSILKAFNEYGELVHPWETFSDIPKGRISKALESLIDSSLVTKSKPFKLTKKARRWLGKGCVG